MKRTYRSRKATKEVRREGDQSRKLGGRKPGGDCTYERGQKK